MHKLMGSISERVHTVILHTALCTEKIEKVNAKVDKCCSQIEALESVVSRLPKELSAPSINSQQMAPQPPDAPVVGAAASPGFVERGIMLASSAGERSPLPPNVSEPKLLAEQPRNSHNRQPDAGYFMAPVCCAPSVGKVSRSAVAVTSSQLIS